MSKCIFCDSFVSCTTKEDSEGQYVQIGKGKKAKFIYFHKDCYYKDVEYNNKRRKEADGVESSNTVGE